jgi:methyl-accepting chemotaxis protein
MRSLTQQTSAAMAEQSRTLGEIAESAREVTEATKRTVSGLGEQARGATEVARAMDDVRREAMQTARAVSEQARAAKDIEASSREVTRLSGEVTRAMQEQTKAAVELTREGEEIRRLSRQSARELGESTEGASGLAAAYSKQLAGLQRMVVALRDQEASVTQVSGGLNDVRARTRELIAGIDQQTREAAAFAGDTGVIATQLARIRQAHVQQVTQLSSIKQSLAQSAPEPARGGA